MKPIMFCLTIWVFIGASWSRPSEDKPWIPPELSCTLEVEIRLPHGFECGPLATRHDPSNIISHNGMYYVWWMEAPVSIDTAGDLSYAGDYRIAYASSPDGENWTLKGRALPAGEPGEWDEHGHAAPYVVPWENKFYMFYNHLGHSYPRPVAYPVGGDYKCWDFRHIGTGYRGIGYAVADSPEGPWKKHPDPVLDPGGKGEWDDLAVADVNIIYFRDKWWLYYKGMHVDPETGEQIARNVGVAVSDNLTGPYLKHPENPLFNGHAFSAWVHRDGVAARGYNDLYWSGDGIGFVKAGNLRLFSDGVYCPWNFHKGNNPEGISWGIASRKKDRRKGLMNWEVYFFSTDMSVK